MINILSGLYTISTIVYNCGDIHILKREKLMYTFKVWKIYGYERSEISCVRELLMIIYIILKSFVKKS